MVDSSSEAIRYALSLARKNGYSEIEIEADETSFEAKLEPLKRSASLPSAMGEGDQPLGPPAGEITSTLVGYYQPGTPPLQVGSQVKKGDLVGIVAALGLANDLESTVSGEVIEVLASPGQALQYGQVIARVKVAE